MENVDSNAILLNCLNISCSALILILKCLRVVMIEDFVLFLFIQTLTGRICGALCCQDSERAGGIETAN